MSTRRRRQTTQLGRVTDGIRGKGNCALIGECCLLARCGCRKCHRVVGGLRLRRRAFCFLWHSSATTAGAGAATATAAATAIAFGLRQHPQ
jgi:hypothetical protein